MSVNRCVCANLTFTALKKTARTNNLDFEALRERTGCCRTCSMCEPYVKRMLATGKTSFEPGTIEVIAPAATGRDSASRR